MARKYYRFKYNSNLHMMSIQDDEKLNQEKGDLGHFMVSLEFNYVPSLWVLKLEMG